MSSSTVPQISTVNTAWDPLDFAKKWIEGIQGGTDAKSAAANKQWQEAFANNPITKTLLAQINRSPADVRQQLLADANAQLDVTRRANEASLGYQQGIAGVTKDITNNNTQNLLQRDEGKTGNILRIQGAAADHELALAGLQDQRGDKYLQYASQQNAADRDLQRQALSQGNFRSILGGLAAILGSVV